MACNIICGDALDVLSGMDPGSVHCCVTSPPYWGLRDYGCDRQIGLEETPEEYVKIMVRVLDQVRHVLRDDGTLWLNMGDSYVNESQPGGADPKIGRRNIGTSQYRPSPVKGLRPKNLIGMPWRLALALQADGWYLRSDIIWHKPNPMPESISDRPTKAHEYIFLLSKSSKYYYDQESIKERASENTHSGGNGVNPKAAKIPAGWDVENKRHDGIPKGRYQRPKQNASFSAAVRNVVERRNKRSVWTVPTQGYPDAHFATFPEDLIKPCILAGCPQGGSVLDPFAGSGTVGKVCEELGRNSILIELNPEYIEMIKRRTAQMGLFCAEGRSICG